MSDALVTQLARALNLPPDAARHTLDHLVAALRDQLDAAGQARVPGLGTFRRDDDGLRFLPDDALARAVNHRYAGLRPIEAGPGSGGKETEEEPTPEPETDDPFADTLSPEATPEEVEPPDTAAFQPLESFLEPEQPEGEPEDEFAPKPTGAFEQVEPDAPLPGTSPMDEPAAEEPLNDEPDEQRDLDDLLAGTWTERADTPGDEHVLGPPPPDDVEEADYALVEPDDPEMPGEKDAEDAVGSEPSADLAGEYEEGVLTATEMGWDDVDWEEDRETEPPYDEEDGLLYDEETEPKYDPEDDTELSVPPVPAEPSPIAVEAPSETEVEPEPPTAAPPVAPAVAATGRPAADRPPAEPARRRGGPLVLLTVLGVVLGIAALLWLLNREPEGPTITERPVPADTSVAAVPPPVTDTLTTPPADTLAAATEAPPEEPASTDPLRSEAGIDLEAGGYTWVVASELDRDAAERRVARYREQGLRAGVVAEVAAGRTRYRVSLGQFGSIAEAEARRTDLPADVPSDSWILQL